MSGGTREKERERERVGGRGGVEWKGGRNTLQNGVDKRYFRLARWIASELFR